MPKTLSKNGNNGAGEHPLSRDSDRILKLLIAVRNGDFSVRIPERYAGLDEKIIETLNEIIRMNQKVTSEVERVCTVVGKEGEMTQRASVAGISGGWARQVQSLNSLIADLAQPTTEVIRVIGAVAQGDLSQTMALEIDGKPLKGEYQRTARIVNGMVEQLRSFSSEVTRVAREVGTEGKLGGQAVVKGVVGVWKNLTDNVNLMASNLTAQVRDIAQVSTAVAQGDLTKKITVEVKGEILKLKNTINIMVDQLRSFASEVTRVAREVGTEGKLGGQAEVKGVAGTWKDLTDNVNRMANNLTTQVRNIAEVTIAVAKGDLTKKITVEVKGEILKLKNTINIMVDQLRSFASEVTRVAREVGTEGKLGGQADVRGVAGTWKDLTDNVNSMASNLTGQVRNIAEVTTAVAKGDLTKKITVPVKGEILELKRTINTMVEQLNSFASEVTRVAGEVGTEGKLGGQAQVKGVAGTWKDLTDNVNSMASNLTGQVRNIAEVTTAVAKGDLSKKITVDVKGEILQLKNTINTMVDQLNSFASEVTRVAREVGTEGNLGGQAEVKGVAGTWKDLTDNVNSMASNLTDQVRNIAEVTTAVANGDLTKKITVEVKGEILKLKNTINVMVDQLNSFASEVTRVAREVGTEGKLGGQAEVKGVAGTWKDLTDNVNFMASNLTTQVRGIAQVVTAVANGDLKRKLILQAKGEIARLADTINNMIDTLALFADQVTSVAREVGTEGQLGGQAKVPGASGLWRDLIDNVNQLAANLTTQVRAIAEVATAVTKGDLTRSITVVAKGEVEALKGNINEMIHNLRETTQKTTAQDWLKTNLAKFSRMLQGQRDLVTVSQQTLSELAPLVSAQHGVIYLNQSSDAEPEMKLLASYAYRERQSMPQHFKAGEGLVGQCAMEKRRILIANPPENYIQISSGLGEARPSTIVVLPVIFEGHLKAVMELASFNAFSESQLSFLEQLTESIGIVLNTIAANMRTEELLQKSQTLTKELQQTNEELEDKARLLSEQKAEVENKNLEVEQAKLALEEKAEQLAITSKYKSQFLANMSHELRTPLNSLLILSKTLQDNSEGNLTSKQVEFSKTIHGAGNDLMELINDILDLSKIESGKVTLELGPVPFQELKDYVERTFRQLAERKGLEFDIELETDLTDNLHTDARRLQQVIRNLLSNAFKFTEKGHVLLKMASVREGWSPDHPILSKAKSVVAFSVVDTGIGIPKDKHQIIFEAFQQAEGGTSRKYGGTGLGLSISRELAQLLGGQIRMESVPGEGSVFTLYLPLAYEAAAIKPQGLTVQLASTESSASSNAAVAEAATDEPLIEETEIEDDRANLHAGDRTVLIVEDDASFARILLEVAHEAGFKGVTTNRSGRVLSMVRKYKPAAITLDICLPDGDGWTALDRLKHDPSTRHIPVQTISAQNDWRRSLRLGALAFLRKPADRQDLSKAFVGLRTFIERPVKRLLVVEDDAAQRQSLEALIGNSDVETTAVTTGSDALAALKSRHFDCLVLDLGLPDISGFQLIEKIKKDADQRDLPIIVYTGKELSSKEETKLKGITEAIIIKDVKSPERLVDETSLFLHRDYARLSESQRKMLAELHRADPVLAGRKVLIVDDDLRNIFALTTVLEQYRMQVSYAESGKDCLQHLKDHPETEILLMDVMMPEMDGYETMHAIRQQTRFKETPVIAITAKAMKGDREKCLEAGASDYLPKPVEVDQLLSLLRVWLYR